MSEKNVESFDAFFAARAAPLVRVLFLRTGDMTRAQDCVQEAFVRAWLRWDALERGASPEAWVRRVAWNLAVSQWRSKLRELTRAGFMFRDQGSDAVDPPPVAEVLAVREAVRVLPGRYQTAIVLHYFENMSVEEIADMTHQPVGTVKSNLFRARAALRLALSEDSPDDVILPVQRTSNGTA